MVAEESTSYQLPVLSAAGKELHLERNRKTEGYSKQHHPKILQDSTVDDI